MAAFVGLKDVVTVIKGFVPRSDVERFAKPQGETFCVTRVPVATHRSEQRRVSLVRFRSITPPISQSTTFFQLQVLLKNRDSQWKKSIRCVP